MSGAGEREGGQVKERVEQVGERVGHVREGGASKRKRVGQVRGSGGAGERGQSTLPPPPPHSH